jgi:Na+/H+-dicarboxylate symporter
MLVIQVLRALAVPLVFFAIIDGIVHISIPKRSIPKLLAVCALNTSIAMLIGLTLMNTLQPGKAWQGKIQSLISATNAKAPDAKKSDDPASPGATLEILPNITYIVPSSLIRPFVYNNLLSVVLIAVFLGSALRAIRQKAIDGAELLERAVHACYHLLLQMLEWTIKAIPLAVLLIVSKVVGNTGPSVFTLLGGFLGIVVAGLLIHALIYYPLAAWVFGRRNPATYFGKSADAVISGLSTNSSLATVPITLRCLEKLGVSHGNARLSACIATNLNNDGITLYEAMAAIFLTQALGMPLGLTGQITVVLASCFAAAGIAGILQLRHGYLRSALHLDLDVGAGDIKNAEPSARAGQLAQTAADAALGDDIDPLDLLFKNPVGACVAALIAQVAVDRHLAERAD